MKALKVKQILISATGKTLMYILTKHRDKTFTIAFKSIEQEYVDTCDISRVSSEDLLKCISEYGYFYLGQNKFVG
jgi:hypothetical protein